MWIGWVVFAAVIVLFSICTAVMSKKLGYADWKLCFIPLGYGVFIQRITDGFKVLGIPVRKYCKTLVLMVAISVVCSLLCYFGGQVIYRPHDIFRDWWDDYNIAFKMICYLPVALCLLVFYFGTIKSTLRIADLYDLRFKFDVLLYLLFIPCLFTYFFVKPENKVDLPSAI